MSSVIRCEPCGKSFTGPVSYNQHLESDKHKKKVLSFGILKNSSGGAAGSADNISQVIQLNMLECSVCEIVFNSIISFQNHSLSPEHAQKVIEKNSENNLADTTVSSITSSSDTEVASADIMKSVDENDKILPTTDMYKLSNLSYASCTICSKIFSGPEPYKQHMESPFHLKKVEMEKYASAAQTNNLTAFFCDPCKKNFSGLVPYNQHMNSEVHRKKVLNLQLCEKYASEVDSFSGNKDSKSEDNVIGKDKNILFYCKICNKQCSGHIPYKDHLNGITHLKNLAKFAREKNNLEPGESIQLVQQQHSNEINFMAASHDINGTTAFQKSNNCDPNIDSILPEIAINLDVMSSEELEESLEIFLPGDTIDFDKSKSKINSDSDDKKSIDVSNEIHTGEHEEHRISHESKEKKLCLALRGEIKENSESRVCEACNVKLLSTDEALRHYESLEHHLNRWK